LLVPLRIYYDIQTGNPFQMTGNFRDDWLKIAPSIEDDMRVYKTLYERNRESFDVIELPFGAYSQDFHESNGVRVNPITKELEFSYPDPNEPEAPPVYQKPLSEEVSELRQENTLLKAQLKATDDRTDFHEDILTEIILTMHS